jgi:hypothetical protein
MQDENMHDTMPWKQQITRGRGLKKTFYKNGFHNQFNLQSILVNSCILIVFNIADDDTLMYC